MTFTELQKQTIKRGLMQEFNILSGEQLNRFMSAKFDETDSQRIVTIQDLHFINKRMKAIDEINKMLDIPHFAIVLDRELRNNLRYFSENIADLKFEELENA